MQKLNENEHREICSHPCPNCECGKLANNEDCYQCGGTGCLDKFTCKMGDGLGCDS